MSPAAGRVVCNTLDDDDARDPHAAEPELIRHCVHCGTGVYVKRLFVELGYRPWCWYCIPPTIVLGTHPLALARSGLSEYDAFLALAEMQEWLRGRIRDEPANRRLSPFQQSGKHSIATGKGKGSRDKWQLRLAMTSDPIRWQS